MINLFRRAWERVAQSAPEDSLHFDRPLLLFQSDDWGRVGVRDREGWEQLRAAGVQLGDQPYDFYTLETAEDLHAIHALFAEHHDAVGRSPSMVMNFIMANVDFDGCAGPRLQEIPLVALSEGLPGPWQRPGLFEAYHRGIREGVFYPALHGLTHFCSSAVTRELETDRERSQFIRKLWRAQTPYIHWRMPWIGYEYWDAELLPDRRFLLAQDQRSAIQRAAEVFQSLFDIPPLSACAPGYRANDDTRAAWFESGVRVEQSGPGERKSPYLDHRGMLHTFRTIEFEPATAPCDPESLVREAETCFTQGLPAVVSIHSINFHSTLRDFCKPTLTLLDQFLTALEKKWPTLLYVHDGDLFHIATEGSYKVQGEPVRVAATTKAPRGQA